MTTKADWQRVNQEVMAKRRRELGEPPAAEEMMAYQRGELSPEQEERIRELLVVYPALARMMSEPFDTGEPQPGEAGYVSDVEIERRWRSMEPLLQARNVTPEPRHDGRVVHFWRRATAALAASLVVAFCALLWQMREKERLRVELADPTVPVEKGLILTPDGHRGGGEAFVEVTVDGETILLPLMLRNDPAYPEFRIEIVDVDAGRSLWKSDVLPRGRSDTASFVVSRDFLRPARYRIVHYGVSGAREQQLSTYSIRVPARP